MRPFSFRFPDAIRPVVAIFALIAMSPACAKPKPKPVQVASDLTDAQLESQRLACAFKAGAMPIETVAKTDPIGTRIPINHIVLVMQENRSFDAYYSHLTVPGQTVEAALDTATNPNDAGMLISRYHWSAATASNGNSDGLDYYCFSDTDHGWDQTHFEFDNGANDGFVTTNNDDGNGNRAMGYYDESDIPYYYALSQAFAISDHHFCSVLGPTWPNRMFYFAATSFGLTYNTFPPDNAPDGTVYQNIFLELAAAKVSWKVYADSLPSPDIFGNVIGSYSQNITSIANFYTDAMNGQLPEVSVVEGNDSGTPPNVDEHPPQDMQLGQAFISTVVNALMTSPNWSSSALFITYDEHGGEYDHVVPPPACAPDDIPLHLGSGDTVDAGFDNYGYRTPLIVVSPYAKHGYVSHEVVDHTSITRFVETRFNLPAMTARDANAWPLLDMFDFQHPDLTVPTLPAASIDPGQQMQCAKDYAPSGGGF